MPVEWNHFLLVVLYTPYIGNYVRQPQIHINTWYPNHYVLQIYKQLAVEMGFDECHLYMRFLQFDYAVFKEGAGKPPPIHITAVQDDDSAVDR